ncbi:MAG: T9SS type A sorting domain-containing protein [Bacteroidales bacterium]|nr:T9SS type A sorting domain-containing protein [Bacteroidales bacterium]
MKKFIFLLVAVACFGMTQAQKLHVDKIYARALSNPEVDIATSPVTFQGVASINSVAIRFSIDFKADIDLPAGFNFSMTFKPFNTTEDAVPMALPNALSAGQVYHYSITGSYACGQYTSSILPVQGSTTEWTTSVGVFIDVPGQTGGGKTETMRIMNVTGIEDAEMENISVYPTSINDNMLKIKGLENTNVSIYAVNGQMVAQPQLMNGDVTIDMSNYVAGLYLVKLQNNNASKVVKVQLVK